MFPHERSLVERLKNEPFVLLGINTDSKESEAKLKDFYHEQAKANGVSWRSAIDGSTRGPICTKWAVGSFPTLYLIDAKGVIRQAWTANGSPGDEVIDKEVDKLVKEAKGK